MTTIPTKILFDADCLPIISKYCWYISYEKFNCYAIANITINGRRTTIKMHRLILGLQKGDPMIDHINHNGLDNRKSNLRLATNSLNQLNRLKHKKASSKIKGIYKHTTTDKYIARLCINGQRRHLGCFEIEESAFQAYSKAMDAFKTLNVL